MADNPGPKLVAPAQTTVIGPWEQIAHRFAAIEARLKALEDRVAAAETDVEILQDWRNQSR